MALRRRTATATHPSIDWYKNFGPRLGFAYSVTPTTVVRGGFAIAYTHGSGARSALFKGTGTVGFSATPSFTQQDRGDAAFLLDSGFPAYTPPPSINPGYGTFYTTLSNAPAAAMNYPDPYLGSRAPYANMYNSASSSSSPRTGHADQLRRHAGPLPACGVRRRTRLSGITNSIRSILCSARCSVPPSRPRSSRAAAADLPRYPVTLSQLLWHPCPGAAALPAVLGRLRYLRQHLQLQLQRPAGHPEAAHVA